MNLFFKLWSIFSVSEKKKFVYINFFIIFMTLLEMLSVGIIIPFFAIILDQEVIKNNSYFISFYKFIGSPNDINLILIFSAILISIFITKNALILFFNFYLNKFLYLVKKRLSSQIYSNNLNKPYKFFLENSSAKLISIINVEIGVFTISFLQPSIIIFSELFVGIGLILFLVIINPAHVIYIFLIVFIFLLVFFLKLKKTLDKYGKDRQEFEIKKLSFLYQGLSNIKETKIYFAEKYFSFFYNLFNEKVLKIEKNVLNLMLLPRHLFEIVIVTSFVIIIIILKFNSVVNSEIITTLAVLAVTGIRFVPMVNKFSNALQRIRLGIPALEKVYSNYIIKDPDFNKETHMPHKDRIIFKNIIEIKNLSFSYENNNNIIEQLNLSIRKGSVIGLIGESGTGKTTLLNLFLGLLKPKEGSISIDGKEISENLDGWKSILSYVPQDIHFLDSSLKNNIAFGQFDSDIDNEQILKSIKLSKIDTFINKFEDGLDTNIGERGMKISGGQKQRIGIARALYFDPQILIMDEATNSLDENTENQIIEELNNIKGKITIIMSSHKTNVLRNCDEIYSLRKGKLEKVK